MKKSSTIVWVMAFFLFNNHLTLAKTKVTNEVSKASKNQIEESELTKTLLELYKKKYPSKKGVAGLKKKTLQASNNAVPALIKVMKDGSYPIQNRWVATFLLGRIMGNKAAAFIAKFSKHPHWMMRMAAIKTLFIIKDHKYQNAYKLALFDESLIVRSQALEIVRKRKLKSLGPDVWKMIFQKSNYAGKKGKRRRTGIIKNVVKTLGDLEYKTPEVTKALVRMIKKDQYRDIFSEVDYALRKITGKNSPNGNILARREFWEKWAKGNKS